MITYFQAIVIGLFQGISELFPVSSLGHSVILPRVLGWAVDQNDPFFLAFLVATHLATAFVLVGFFWKDWLAIVSGMLRSLGDREITSRNPYGRLGWLLVVGTIPAGIIGLLLQEPLRSLFASPRLAAFFLILNGLMLYGAETLRTKKAVPTDEKGSDERLSRLSWNRSFGIGIVQSLALIPGFSRSGATMGGGLLAGLNNEDAARFSFLLATPIIAAANILKLPDLFQPAERGLLGQALVGSLCAGIAAYFSVRFLVRFFQSNRLTPFALYCCLAGITFSLILLTR